MTKTIKKIITSGLITVTLLGGGKMVIDYQDKQSQVVLEQKAMNKEELTFEEFYMLIKPDGLINKKVNKLKEQDNKVRLQNFNSESGIFRALKFKEALLEIK